MSLFDEARARLWAVLADLTDGQLNVRPAEGWSVLDVLEHLYRMEMAVAEKLAEAIQRPPMEPVPFKEHANRFMLDRSQRFKAPPFCVPTGLFSSLLEARAGLDQSRQSIEAALALAQCPDDLYTHALMFPLPAVGLLSAGQWYDFLACHEMRHTEQVEEMKASWTRIP